MVIGTSPRLRGDGIGMPKLPRDIGEQIAGHRSRRRRLLEVLRRLFGLKPAAPDADRRNPKPSDRDRV